MEHPALGTLEPTGDNDSSFKGIINTTENNLNQDIELDTVDKELAAA